VIVFSNLGERLQTSQFGDGVGLPTTIGVGVRRGVGTGVNAGRGVVAVGRGTTGVDPVGAGVATVVGASAGVAVATGTGAPGVICPDSKIRATFSRLISISILPFVGGVGGASGLPFRVIWTLSAKPR
jgi:hypothetical protein